MDVDECPTARGPVCGSSPLSHIGVFITDKKSLVWTFPLFSYRNLWFLNLQAAVSVGNRASFGWRRLPGEVCKEPLVLLGGNLHLQSFATLTLSRSVLAKCSDLTQLKSSGHCGGGTGPFSCCRCVCWLTWLWFIVHLKPWVGPRPGGTEATSTAGTSPYPMTVKRRRDPSKHLASLPYLSFQLCITAQAHRLVKIQSVQLMSICPGFERPLQVEPVTVGPICCPSEEQIYGKYKDYSTANR